MKTKLVRYTRLVGAVALLSYPVISVAGAGEQLIMQKNEQASVQAAQRKEGLEQLRLDLENEARERTSQQLLKEANLEIARLSQQVAELQSMKALQCDLKDSDVQASKSCNVSDMPYADPASYKSDSYDPIKQLAKKITRDRSDVSKYMAENLMFYVAEGGYQQAILTLAKSFNYNKVIFEDQLDKKKYNCKIESGFWIKGRDFASLSEQIIKPYRISMTIHTPDSVVVVKKTGKKNPCKSK